MIETRLIISDDENTFEDVVREVCCVIEERLPGHRGTSALLAVLVELANWRSSHLWEIDPTRDTKYGIDTWQLSVSGEWDRADSLIAEHLQAMCCDVQKLCRQLERDNQDLTEQPTESKR